MEESIEKKIKVLEVDQWTSTGDMGRFNFETFQLLNVKGGDSEAIRRISGGHAIVKEVSPNDIPSRGNVWYTEVDEKFKLYKANYDSSD